MGEPIAERLRAAGYPLAVSNRTMARAAALVDAGATLLAGPADALDEADVCVTMLADDGALVAVVCGPQGILTGARRGTTLIDMSTVSVGASKRVAGEAAAAGVRYLRAPVSGNPSVVRAGASTVIVSGPEGAFLDLAELLRSIGPNVFYVGDGERARVVKLALQVLIAGTAELLAEALVLIEAAEIDRATFLEVTAASAAGSPFVKYKIEPLLRDDYSATFTTEMMLKDIELILDQASSSATVLPVTRELRRLPAETAATYGDLDFMALFLQLRNVTNSPRGRFLK
ncbi:MAG: NAD(P)-dependent oxidoreductase [Actinomycetota bacterium]|nr:NAD(P)-dependent oxidoreductase [Actinomycetota bacterium]